MPAFAGMTFNQRVLKIVFDIVILWPNMHPYVGRFAPSPTGPLHIGSLIAATASYLQARSVNGAWLLRIEDLDPPREMPGAGDDILRTLEAYGFTWDGAVLYQSRRHPIYQDTLDRLSTAGMVYPCACTRSEIADSHLDGPHGPVYPGTCRNGLPAGRSPRALRVRCVGATIEYVDDLLGPQRHDLETEVGDFVVRRADGLYAYQLAVVLDDALQGVTQVVRGSDLLDSTPRQIHLQRLLGLPTPGYLHVPVAVNAHGEKLSKQTGAAAVDRNRQARTLGTVLRLLGQRPPTDLYDADLDALWHWAITHWNTALLPRVRQVSVDAESRDFGYHDRNDA